jgi:Peptidase_C39 like family
MPLMLVTLFAFALLVTLAGFFLSFKSQVHGQKVSFRQPRPGRQMIDDRRRVNNVPRRASRYDLPDYERSGRMVDNRATRALSIPSLGGQLGRRRAGEPVPWTVVVIGVVSVFVLGLFAFNLFMPHTVFNLTWLSNSSQAQSTPSASQPKLYGASKNLARLGQLDPGQYSSAQEYSLWAYSACSSAAMAEVINAYGHHFRVTDILKVEASMNEITPSLGLVEDIGVARTMAKFGFKTTWGYTLSYDQVVATANQGEPVIVAWPPSHYDGGHVLVVVGGNSQNILLADSSRYDRHSLTRTQFMKWWAGFSAVATPQ